MTRSRTSIAAAFAAIAMGAAVAAPMQAQAFEGGYRGHHAGHGFRGHRGGFGGGAAFGMGMVGGMVLGGIIAEVARPKPYGVATDLTTGETTEVAGVPFGRVVTKRDRNGRLKGRPELKPKHSRSWASSTDPRTGVTVTSRSNGDGTRTVTRTAANGDVISQDVVR